MNTAAITIEFKNVEFSVAGGKVLLSGVSFSVRRGETLALLGRSGSGKTTCLKMINRLLAPTRGEVRVDGTPVEQWDGKKMEARVTEVLDLVGLPTREFADRYPHQLSGGQRQRVGLARSLAADPPILLMDEPFGALDPITRAELQTEFGKLQQKLGKTIVFVTHDVGEALLLGDRIGLMESGKLRGIYTPDEFLRAADAGVKAYVDVFRAGQQMFRT